MHGEPHPTTVTFRVVCHGLDPTRVTEVTGIVPTEIDRGGPMGGQKVTLHGTQIQLPTGSWSLQDVAGPGQSLDYLMGRIIDRFDPHVASLRALQDCRLYVVVYGHMNKSFSNWCDDLSAESLSRIAALGATLQLDVDVDPRWWSDGEHRTVRPDGAEPES